MLPSEVNRQGWFSVLLFGGLVILLFALVGLVPRVLGEVTFWASRGLDYLNLALLIALVMGSSLSSSAPLNGWWERCEEKR